MMSREYFEEFECNCAYCQSLCNYRVGWFLPEEAKAFVEYMLLKGHSVPEIFRKFLVIDWWEGEKKPIFVVAPRWTACGERLFAPFIPLMINSSCVFKDENGCKLHGLKYNGILLKPFECRVSGCRTNYGYDAHKFVAMQWKDEREFWDKYVAPVEKIYSLWLNQSGEDIKDLWFNKITKAVE